MAANGGDVGQGLEKASFGAEQSIDYRIVETCSRSIYGKMFTAESMEAIGTHEADIQSTLFRNRSGFIGGCNLVGCVSSGSSGLILQYGYCKTAPAACPEPTATVSCVPR